MSYCHTLKEKYAPEKVIKFQAFVASYVLLASYRLQISLQVRQLSLKNENILELYRVITLQDSWDGTATKLWHGISKNRASFSRTEILFSATHHGRVLGLFIGPRNHLIREPKVRKPEPISSLSYTSALRDA
jgi:hypothetical protein